MMGQRFMEYFGGFLPGLGVTGVGFTPYRARAAEEILLGTAVAEQDVATAPGAILEDVEVAGDAYASSDYRGETCRLFAQPALETARTQARG